MLGKCIRKINEVAQDLREMDDRSDPEYQAKKLDKVAEDLTALKELVSDDPGASTQVHGSGTGKS